MILTPTAEIANREIERTFGLVSGNAVMSKHVGLSFLAGFKSIVGGEIKDYTDLLTQTRTTATNRMSDHARSIGADAIVNVRFATSSIMPGASEILVYGSAVKLKDL